MAPQEAHEGFPRFPPDRPNYTAPFGLTRDQYELLLDSDEGLRQLAPFFLVTLLKSPCELAPGEKNETPWLGPMVREDVSPTVSGSPGYALVDTPGKGKGLIATEDLEPGSILFAESPLFTLNWDGLPPDGSRDIERVNEKLSTLSKEDREAYDSLRIATSVQRLNEPKPLAIFRTNSSGMDNGETGIWLLGSRFNHSCVPNMFRGWNEEEGKEYFIVCRNIKKGEELVTSYTLPWDLKEERDIKLEETWGINCSCEACSNSPEAIERSDRARIEISQIFEYFHRDVRVEREELPLKFHGVCCRGMQLLHEERLSTEFEVKLAHGAYMTCVLFACRPLADIWIETVLRLLKRRGLVTEEMREEFQAYQVLKEDHTCHPCWGVFAREEEEED
ncbi:SET domain-containing protein [Sporobolomyces salmoneus]|uniref:SET domain-containing protein n=1 Tax=Sporobolomyces salmoneus TaxID=183962 RepID=UPI00317F05B5